jgi:hypothetical protein
LAGSGVRGAPDQSTGASVRIGVDLEMQPKSSGDPHLHWQAGQAGGFETLDAPEVDRVSHPEVIGITTSTLLVMLDGLVAWIYRLNPRIGESGAGDFHERPARIRRIRVASLIAASHSSTWARPR